MATEAQRAPRVARDQTSMADAAASVRIAAQAEAVKTLTSFRFNDTTPFSGAGDELAWDCLREAHALSIVLSNSLCDRSDQDNVIRNVHLSGAIDAVSTLLALAAFGLTDEQL